MEIKTGRTAGMTESYNSNSFSQLVALQSSIPFIQQGLYVKTPKEKISKRKMLETKMRMKCR
jgi:hypothetical protein